MAIAIDRSRYPADFTEAALERAAGMAESVIKTVANIPRPENPFDEPAGVADLQIRRKG